MTRLSVERERRGTISLALLVVAILAFPVSAGAQDIEAEPGAGVVTEPTEEPTEEATEAPTPEAAPPAVEAPATPPGDQVDDAPTAAPVPPAPPAAGQEPSGGRAYVIPEDLRPDAGGEAPAEGGAEEARPPEVPGAGTDGDVGAAEGGAVEEVPAPAAPEGAAAPDTPEAAAAPDEPAAAADAADAAADAPPPIEIYGPQVVPSLGTATAPGTQDFTVADSPSPLVLAPMVAGAQVKPGGITSTGGDVDGIDKQPLLSAPEQVRQVAAASLSIVRPSWYATATALAILLGAAAYATMLRRRGEEVPEALRIPGSVRPGDRLAVAVRSVRPVDLDLRQASSVRPE